MAAEKVISELNELTTVDQNADWVPVVDVSDTSASEFGTTKKALVEQFIGPTGAAATVDVGTTTTGAPGSDASVVNSGSTSAAVFDFTIPRGATGATGATGAKGDKGDKGDQGIQGIQGIQGVKGDKGDNAYVYIAYASDDSGTGFTTTFNASLDYIAIKTTTTEIISPQASDFTGLWKNYKGTQGIQGIQGIQGDAGTNGTNAYVYIAYASDASGTGFTMTFNASLDYIAIKATTVAIGSPQASDFTGLWKNYKGAQGIQGIQGNTGANGLDINWLGAYDNSTNYVINDAVSYSGSSYICKLSSTGNLPTNTTYWDLMAQKGADGAGSGDVSGPATNTDSYIPQWNGANSKTLKDGLALTTTVGSPGSDTSVPTEKAIRTAINGFTSYTDEQAQDAVGGILADTTTIDFTYTDATPEIKADVKSASLTTTHLASGVLDTDLSTVSAFDDTIPSAKATKAMGDLKIAKATNVTAINDTGIADGEIALFNLTNKDIRTSDKTIVTTLGADDTTVPTSKAVKDVTDARVVSNAAITGATKTKITYDAKGLVTGGADATTADIADSTNKRYVNDAQLTVIGNTSGTNTGDSASIPIGYLDTTTTLGTSDVKVPSQKAVKTYVDGTKFTWKGAWATSTAYVANDAVQQNGSGYICLTAHTSGTFATDLAAGKWSLFVEGVGGNSIQVDCTGGTSDTYGVLSGNVNGSNKRYTVSLAKYISGSLRVYLNGQLQTQGSSEDWVETTPTSGTFTFNTAPATGDIITAMYQFSSGATGNADTLDGNHASAFAPESEWNNGWISAGETWTYASADDPTYTFTVAADVTGKYSAGMKIKLTQTTVKYFIITAVSAYTGGNTTITVYGGTDYDLANAAISANYYSMVRCPFGFPMSPVKWSVETTSTSNSEQLTPTVNVWYNIGAVSLSIPIGTWDTYYKCEGHHYRSSGASYCSIYATLSTANNSASDADFTCHGFSRDVISHSAPLTSRKVLVLSSKTTYYLNFMTDQSSTAGMNHYGGLTKTIVRATCAYL